MAGYKVGISYQDPVVVRLMKLTLNGSTTGFTVAIRINENE